MYCWTAVNNKLQIPFSVLALEYSEILLQLFAFILIVATLVYFIRSASIAAFLFIQFLRIYVKQNRFQNRLTQDNRNILILKIDILASVFSLHILSSHISSNSLVFLKLLWQRISPKSVKFYIESLPVKDEKWFSPQRKWIVKYTFY